MCNKDTLSGIRIDLRDIKDFQTTNLDPIWEYGFVRPFYTFNIANAPDSYAKDDGSNSTDPLP